MKRILFICMGNICRSPAAEGIMQSLIDQHQLGNQIAVDSCATHGYHVGHHPDPRMLQHAEHRGYRLTSIARQFDPQQDFQTFDHLLVMDDDNHASICSLGDMDDHKKVQKITDFCRQQSANYVPDPYYDQARGFEIVLDILEDACQGLLQHLQSR